MNLNQLNKIITNKQSRELQIEILVNNKPHYINHIESDFNNEVLLITLTKKEDNNE